MNLFTQYAFHRHTLSGLIHHYMTILSHPSQGNIKINNFGKGLPGLPNYEFSFSYRCVVEEKIFEKKIKYFLFLNKTHINPILPSANLPCNFQDEVKTVNR